MQNAYFHDVTREVFGQSAFVVKGTIFLRASRTARSTTLLFPGFICLEPIGRTCESCLLCAFLLIHVDTEGEGYLGFGSAGRLACSSKWLSTYCSLVTALYLEIIHHYFKYVLLLFINCPTTSAYPKEMLVFAAPAPNYTVHRIYRPSH